MADSVNVSSVQPSEISKDMVAYLLTVSVLGGEGYSKSWSPSSGLPIIQGFSKEEILTTYTECARAVARHKTDSEFEEAANRRR